MTVLYTVGLANIPRYTIRRCWFSISFHHGTIYFILSIVFYCRTQWTALGSVFGAVTFLFVHEIYPEPLDGLNPNSQGRRVWFLARRLLNVKVKGQRSRSPGQKRSFQRISLEPLNVFATNSHGTRVWSLARTRLKVKVNFGVLRSVCYGKNAFVNDMRRRNPPRCLQTWGLCVFYYYHFRDVIFIRTVM